MQLALEAGARVIGTRRDQHRDTVLGLGAHAFVDLREHRLEDLDGVDVVLDVIGGETLDRSAKLVRPGGVLVTVAEPPRVVPDNGRAMFFVVEPDLVSAWSALNAGSVMAACAHLRARCGLSPKPSLPSIRDTVRASRSSRSRQMIWHATKQARGER